MTIEARVETDEKGDLILIDPAAAAMVKAVAKYNCRATLEQQRERVAHFCGRILQRGMTPAEVVIVLINVDTEIGSVLADHLMPGADWQAMRDRGEVPFARGLAMREGLQAMIDVADSEAGSKFRAMIDEIAVVVVDHGTIEVLAA